MRAFFGLSPDIKTKLAIQVWRSKAFACFNAPVPAANFHITLAFLGQISPQQREALCEGVNQIPEVQTFDVLLNQVGYWSKPKAFWLGCQDTQNEHLHLSKSLTQVANTIGLALPKQNYIAHLTLAKKCSLPPPAPLMVPKFTWHNTEFHLYESVSVNRGVSGKKGVSYHIRHTWPLARLFALKSV